jgi:dolichyl-phosphate beta-glucosyltransferase
MPRTVALVVPCYNEAARLDVAAFAALAGARSSLRLVFVDDGSSDRTAAVLEQLRAVARGDIRIVRHERNAGKAEAVRRGLLAAAESGAEVVGFADADLATPPEELLRMMRDMDARPVPVLLAARVRLLGSRVERHAARHYLGRLFATVASLVLGIPVYDTQCGAKLFLASPALDAALARPFRSRWIFDVELLDRLLRGAPGVAPLASEQMRELPLATWRDVPGSTLRPRAMLRAGLQLLALLVRSRLRRLLGRGPAPSPGTTAVATPAVVAVDGAAVDGMPSAQRADDP